MKLLLVVLLLASISCISDKQLAANAGASYTYHEAAYEHDCCSSINAAGECVPASPRPPYCQKLKDALPNAQWEAQQADLVYKAGALPKDEKRRLKAAVAATEVLP